MTSTTKDEALTGADRRRMLKSGLLMAVGAGIPSPGPAQTSGTGMSTAMATSHSVGRPGALSRGMISFTLSHEQFPVPELVRLGAEAERAGFDLVSTSDQFQPWQANERHTGLAWVTLGALGQQTRRIWMGTAVTCPTLRYNPGIVAEAFATLALLYPGRIFLGLGSGEALNEQATTGLWPAWRERWDRLIEAVSIIRQLWTGQVVQYKGAHFTIDGRLYDRHSPKSPHPI